MQLIRNTLILFMLLFSISSVCALQSEYIENRQSGAGVVSSFHYLNGSPKLVIEPSYSIDGYMDIGVSVDIKWGEDLLDTPSRETDATISLGFSAFKQDQIMPVSVLLQMGLHYLSEISDEYEDNDIISSGTGFSIGAKIFRYEALIPRLYIRFGIEANQRLDTIIIDQPSGSSLLPMSTTRNTFTYGVLTGLTLRPNTPNKGVATSCDIGLYRNSNGEYGVTGSVVFTLVENQY